MEKRVLADVLEGTMEPIKNLEYIMKIYGIKRISMILCNDEDGFLDMNIDEENVNRFRGKWKHTEHFSFGEGKE